MNELHHRSRSRKAHTFTRWRTGSSATRSHSCKLPARLTPQDLRHLPHHSIAPRIFNYLCIELHAVVTSAPRTSVTVHGRCPLFADPLFCLYSLVERELAKSTDIRSVLLMPSENRRHISSKGLADMPYLTLAALMRGILQSNRSLRCHAARQSSRPIPWRAISITATHARSNRQAARSR